MIPKCLFFSGVKSPARSAGQHNFVGLETAKPLETVGSKQTGDLEVEAQKDKFSLIMLANVQTIRH